MSMIWLRRWMRLGISRTIEKRWRALASRLCRITPQSGPHRRSWTAACAWWGTADDTPVLCRTAAPAGEWLFQCLRHDVGPAQGANAGRRVQPGPQPECAGDRDPAAIDRALQISG